MSFARSLAQIFFRLRSPKAMCPVLGVVRPVRHLSRVVLPAPFAPRITVNSPRLKLIEVSCSSDLQLTV